MLEEVHYEAIRTWSCPFVHLHHSLLHFLPFNGAHEDGIMFWGNQSWDMLGYIHVVLIVLTL